MDHPERFPNLFLAVPLPEPVKERVAAAAAAARRELPFRKWVHPADYHLTVKFLGGLNPAWPGKLKTIVEPVAARHGRFRLELAAPGTFGSAEAPRILWLGVGGEQSALHALQQATDSALATAGFAPETRPYRPHVTVARQWTGSGKPARERLIQPFASLFGPDGPPGWDVAELMLYRTRMGKLPMYEVVDRYPLEKH